MRGDDELREGAGLAQSIDDQVQGLRVQAMVDLLDTGERRGRGIIEQSQEAEEPYSSAGGVGQRSGPAQAAFHQLDSHLSGTTTDRRELDVLKLWKHGTSVVQKSPPEGGVFAEEVQESGQVVGTGRQVAVIAVIEARRLTRRVHIHVENTE